jgi:hypothetical protein
MQGLGHPRSHGAIEPSLIVAEVGAEAACCVIAQNLGAGGATAPPKLHCGTDTLK